MPLADETLAPLWAPGMRLNRTAYRDLEFPFERLPWPPLEATARMRLADLLRYVGTWSASQAWERAHGGPVTEVIRQDLTRAWGDPEGERLVRWPLHGAIGRVG